MSKLKPEYDVIIIGAGSAGCAAAYRIAKESKLDVLLLEAGTPAKSPLFSMPLGFAFLLKEHDNNWNYKTTAEPNLNNREVELPRGKVLGGCSAINGMVYIRGQKEDYDDWAMMGNPGWSYEDVLPIFKRSEENENGANQFRGAHGPLWVGNVKNEFPICDAFIDACVQAGHPRNDDVNGESQVGAGFFPNNVKNGKRWSSATAFLGAGADLPNLHVETLANTKRVVIENGKAVAVEFVKTTKKNKILSTHTVKARKEIIVSGGAINSPKILEMSGIGQKDRLEKLGIKLEKELPGVGENLHDHWNAYIKRTVANGSTYFAESKPLAMIKNLFRYLFKKTSFLANPAALVTVFYQSVEESGRAESQIHFAPAASEVDAKGNMLPIDGITIAACGLRPTSRGHTHIQSADVLDKPAIHVNFLDTDYDKKVAVESLRKARDIFKEQALKTFGGEELVPSAKLESDEDLLAYIKETGEPVHHLAGSCKMGKDDMAVVNHELKVHGIEGLRVADASIMPVVVSGNTHAACVMIGERAADFVLAAS